MFFIVEFERAAKIRKSGPGTECVTLTTKCFASAVVQDLILSVWRVLADSNE